MFLVMRKSFIDVYEVEEISAAASGSRQEKRSMTRAWSESALDEETLRTVPLGARNIPKRQFLEDIPQRTMMRELCRAMNEAGIPSRVQSHMHYIGKLKSLR